MTVYLKILGSNRESLHGGDAKWKKGRWMPERPVRMCQSGYHLIEPFQLLDWWQENCTVWLSEGRGEHQTAADKSCWAEARIIRQLHTPTLSELIIYAADCAEHVLPIFEDAYPNDDRPRKAIEAARAWVGHPSVATADSYAAAAHAAAHAVARARATYGGTYAATNAADAASQAATYAADAAEAAETAARARATYVATYAAEAAEAAARARATYAAADATYAATYAAEAAHAAARARVTYAATYATYAAADAAERKWQSGRMMAFLTGSL